ncbi:MAG: hypothetical protein AMXMBFR33_01440 [Candidatus Xenobia bacterium]
MLTVTDAQGRSHRLRRLGYDDLYDLAEILQEALGRGSSELNTRLRGVDSSVETFAAALLLGLPATRELLAEWLADVLQVPVPEFQDPELFPLPVQLECGRALARHPDVQAFFFGLLGEASGRGLLARLGEMASGWLSTFSSLATGAPDKTG